LSKFYIESVGYAIDLMPRRGCYANIPIASIWAWLLPPEKLDQLHLFLNREGRVIGYVTWALLNEKSHQPYEHGDFSLLNPPQWNEGSYLWIIDFVALPGYVRICLRQAKQLFHDRDVIFYMRKNSKQSSVPMIVRELYLKLTRIKKSCIKRFYMKLKIATTLLTVFSVVAHAENDLDVQQCRGDSNEIINCLQKISDHANDRLNEIYTRLNRMFDSGSNNPIVISGIYVDRKKSLKQAQQAWIKYRETQCHFTAMEITPGSSVASVTGRCEISLTLERINYLEEILSQEEYESKFCLTNQNECKFNSGSKK